MSRPSFRDHLADNVVVFDGGVGTSLYGKGIFINRAFEELNLSNPSLVRSVHGEYLRAGADVLETNTFGANAVKLEAHGARDRLEAINYRGAKLAREVAADRAWVGGSMGPLGIKIEPWGPTSVDEARALFREQAQALLEGGVDLFVLETFSDVNEIRQAILAVRDVAPDAFVLAQMTLGEDGNSLYGTAPEVFAVRLEQWGADAVGINCSVGPAVMLDAVERLVRVVHRPVSVQPNAGLPRLVDGRHLYLASPEYMASYARRFLDAGARIVGGCCGTTPEHVRAIRQAVGGRPAPAPARTAAPPTAPVEAPAASLPPGASQRPASRLARELDAGAFVRAVQIRSPRGFDAGPAIAAVRELVRSGHDLVFVDEGPRTSARMNGEAFAVLLEREAGAEPVLRFCCHGRNLLGMQGVLLGAHALGLRNLVCETGDAVRVGDYPDPTAPFDVDSIGLVNMVRRLNQGFDVGGNPIGRPTSWLAGVAVNPGALDLEAEVRRFAWKVEAGARFAVTAPVFDLGLLVTLLERIRGIRIPVLLGIVPLLGLAHAEYLGNEVPGCPIPGPVFDRMRRAESRSGTEALAEGLAIAREILAGARGLVEGAVVSVPVEHLDLAARVLEVAAVSAG